MSIGGGGGGGTVALANDCWNTNVFCTNYDYYIDDIHTLLYLSS